MEIVTSSVRSLPFQAKDTILCLGLALDLVATRNRLRVGKSSLGSSR